MIVALWSWWTGDSLPSLEPLAAMRVLTTDDSARIVAEMGIAREETTARIEHGHRAYVAEVDGVPAAYGWVASLGASIGELGIGFSLARSDRYLWDFVTLPAFRGRGIYPRLLREIIAREGQSANRFWIINAPENVASAAGIEKAGFVSVGQLSFIDDRRAGVAGEQITDRAAAGAALLGVPLLRAVEEGRVVSPCWRCVMAAQQRGDEAMCWPQQGVAHHCSCA
jgi:GNAT superfamily N-acetyltransferase